MNNRVKLGVTALGILIISAGVFYACKKDRGDSVINGDGVLKTELNTLNNEIYSQMDISTQKLDWGRIAGQALAVAGADAIGTYEGFKIGAAIGAAFGPQGAATGGTIGGVICGGGASYTAGVTVGVFKSMPPESSLNELSSKYSDFNISGILHNRYLNLLVEKSTDVEPQTIYSQIFIDVPYLDIDIYNKIFEKLGHKSQHSDEMLSLINNYVRNDFNIDILLNQYKEKFGMSKEAEEVWHSFFEMYFSVTKIEEAYLVIERYIDFIQESGSKFLTSDEINSFNAAFSVALHSTNYWSILTKE